MAHSILVFRGRSEVINDLDLMVLFIFLRDVIGEVDDGPTRQLLGKWEQTLRHYGPGVIDLELEALEADATEAQKFTAALAEVRERLGRFGERIPKAVLDARNITPGVVFADYSVTHVIEAATRLVHLLSR